MKIHILQTCILSIMMAATFTVMAAPHTTPVRSIAIPPANSGVVIDGQADADYSTSQTTTAFNVTGSTGADADFTGSFQVCYDMNRLYILWNILDDYACEIPFTTSPDPWTWDNVEVFLSLDTIGTTTAYDTNTIQLRFNRGIQDSAQTPGRADQSEYDGFVYSENTANGYVIEVGIPWAAVLSEAQLPEDIELYNGNIVNGFDVSCADNDTDGPDARDCQTAWDDDDPAMPDATEDLAWNDRTKFGVMTLSGTLYGPPWGILSPDPVRYISETVYPNPATGKIQLKNIDPATSIVIYDVVGNKVLEAEQINENDFIDMSFLKKGIYFVQLNDSIESIKLIVE